MTLDAMSTPLNNTLNGHAQHPTISQLLADIGELDNLILYYENRKLRKQLAIEEIVHSQQCQSENPVIAKLNESQLLILRRLSSSVPMDAIATEMNLSRKCVEYHRHKLQQKLGVPDGPAGLVEMTRIALREGLVK